MCYNFCKVPSVAAKYTKSENLRCKHDHCEKWQVVACSFCWITKWNQPFEKKQNAKHNRPYFIKCKSNSVVLHIFFYFSSFFKYCKSWMSLRLICPTVFLNEQDWNVIGSLGTFLHSIVLYKILIVFVFTLIPEMFEWHGTWQIKQYQCTLLLFQDLKRSWDLL